MVAGLRTFTHLAGCNRITFDPVIPSLHVSVAHSSLQNKNKDWKKRWQGRQTRVLKEERMLPLLLSILSLSGSEAFSSVPRINPLGSVGPGRCHDVRRHQAGPTCSSSALRAAEAALPLDNVEGALGALAREAAPRGPGPKLWPRGLRAPTNGRARFISSYLIYLPLLFNTRA